MTSARVIYDKASNGFMVHYSFGENDMSETVCFYVDKGLTIRVFQQIAGAT